ncbi:hypothetical protein [Ekhidna sp.]|uniref:hypothetical protein n=1 Tax=Ekhidna sp. TaxID=2608089 RepID=UPI0032EC8EA4
MNLGKLEHHGSKVDYYTPTYLNREFESVPEIEEVTIELLTATRTHELQMPYSMKGECQRIIITDSLTIKSKWDLN